MSEETASKAEQRAVALRQAMLDFQRFDGDTGSSEVQGGHHGMVAANPSKWDAVHTIQIVPAALLHATEHLLACLLQCFYVTRDTSSSQWRG